MPKKVEVNMDKPLVFGPLLGSLFMGDTPPKGNFYPYDVYATMGKNGLPTNYIIEIALAGVDKSACTVQLNHEGALEVIVTPNKELKENIKVVKSGISYRKAKIAFELIKGVDFSNITSSFKDGLLQIVIPMKKAEDASRIIKIM